MKNGIYNDIPENKYHGDIDGLPRLSSSIAKILWQKTPQHAFLAHSVLNKNYKSYVASNEMNIGSAAHSLVLEGNDSKIVCIEEKDFRKNVAKEQRDDALANSNIPLLQKDCDKVFRMRDSANNYIKNTELRHVFDNGDPEVTILSRIFDVDFKSRLDWLTDDFGFVIDYKTSVSANPNWFERQIASMCYDVQSAAYLKAVFNETGNINTQYFWFIQETSYPYLCSIIGVSEALRDIGERKLEYCCGVWDDCLKNNNWPGYPEQIAYAQPRNWDIMDVEEKLGDESYGNDI